MSVKVEVLNAAAEDRVLAAIEDLHNQSLTMIEAKTDFEISNIQQTAFIAVAALEKVSPALNLKERKGGD